MFPFLFQIDENLFWESNYASVGLNISLTLSKRQAIVWTKYAMI